MEAILTLLAYVLIASAAGVISFVITCKALKALFGSRITLRGMDAEGVVHRESIWIKSDEQLNQAHIKFQDKIKAINHIKKKR